MQRTDSREFIPHTRFSLVIQRSFMGLSHLVLFLSEQLNSGVAGGHVTVMADREFLLRTTIFTFVSRSYFSQGQLTPGLYPTLHIGQEIGWAPEPVSAGNRTLDGQCVFTLLIE